MILLNKNLNLAPLIVAEIGVNHEGDFESALKLLKLAAECGVDVVKFQSYTAEKYSAADDLERYKRISKFSLSLDNYYKLYNQAKKLNLGFLSTPLTEDWVDKLNDMCPAFKIASGDITFKPVIQKAAQTGKPILLSTGAATIEEIDRAVSWIKTEIGEVALRDRLILMHCVASYPAPFNQANLLSIPYLKERYNVFVGYSNHVVEPEVSIAAVALGASVVEVHFTDSKEGRVFRDHQLSFTPEEMKNFVKQAKIVFASRGEFNKIVQPCEEGSIQAIRKGIIAVKDIPSGKKLSKDDLGFARPAHEFSSNDLSNLIGKKVINSVSKGYLIRKSNII